MNLQQPTNRKVSRTAVPHSSAVLASGTAGATGATAGALQWDSMHMKRKKANDKGLYISIYIYILNHRNILARFEKTNLCKQSCSLKRFTHLR